MSETRARSRVPRRIGAVFAGLLVVVILSTVTDLVLHGTGIFPPPGQPMATGLWVLASAYRIVFGVAGGYVAARLAPDWPMRHALVLGAVGTIASVTGAVATWNMGPGFGPKWYPLGLVVTALPSTWAGAKLLGGKPRASSTG